MPGKESPASKEQVDRLLKAASPNNGFDVLGIRKMFRKIAFKKLMATLSGPHRPMFVREHYEQVGGVTKLERLIEELKRKNKKN